MCSSVMWGELTVDLHVNRGYSNAQELFRPADLAYVDFYT